MQDRTLRHAAVGERDEDIQDSVAVEIIYDPGVATIDISSTKLEEQVIRHCPVEFRLCTGDRCISCILDQLYHA